MVQLPRKHSVAGFNMFMALHHVRKQLSKLFHLKAINLLIYDVTKSQSYTNSPNQAHCNRSSNFAIDLPKVEKPSFSRYFPLALKIHYCYIFFFSFRNDELTRGITNQPLLYGTIVCKLY